MILLIKGTISVNLIFLFKNNFTTSSLAVIKIVSYKEILCGNKFKILSDGNLPKFGEEKFRLFNLFICIF